LWYICGTLESMPSSTTSIRINDDLRARLEEASRVIKKGKNWIITKALEEYLEKNRRAALAAEASRQSLLIREEKWEDEEFWEKMADTTGRR